MAEADGDVSGMDAVEVTEAFLEFGLASSDPLRPPRAGVDCWTVVRGRGTGAEAEAEASWGVVGVVVTEEADLPEAPVAFVTGKSSTRSGVCLFFLSQKLLFD